MNARGFILIKNEYIKNGSVRALSLNGGG